MKPPGKNPEKEQLQIDKAMRRVREATCMIEGEIDPGKQKVYMLILKLGSCTLLCCHNEAVLELSPFTLNQKMHILLNHSTTNV